MCVYVHMYVGVWNEDLENSLLELLVAVSDDLEAAIRSWQPMMVYIYIYMFIHVYICIYI
jgi:hypothetical protein